MSSHEEQATPSFFDDADRAADFIEDDTIMTPLRERPRRASEAGEGERLIDMPQFQTDPAPAVDEPAAAAAEPAVEAPPQPQTPPAPVAPPPATPGPAASTEPDAAPAEGDEDDALFSDPARLLSTQATLQAPTKATKGVRGMLASIGLNVKPSPAELKEREHAQRMGEYEAHVRQTTWPRAVGVLVANKKGGTGKTPTALGLAGTIATIRGGQTVVLEVSDDPGALTYRAEGDPALGLGDLVRDVETITSAGQLTGYTAPQTSFAAVIGSTGRRERLTRDAVVRVAGLLDEFYAVRVMDSGNQPTSSAFQGAVEVADVLVVPLLNAGDSALEAVQLLDELRAGNAHSRYLADHAIAVRLIDGRMEHDRVTRSIEKLLLRNGVKTLLQIPYDPHIAERGQITLSRLQPATREAFTTLASQVVTAATAAVRKA